jgi:Ca2+-binding EF-hand superfamily protein
MTHRLPFAILTAAILSVPALALAGHGHGPDRNASPACAARHAEKLATYDANADGALDREERMAIRRDRRAAALARHDANRDGMLDRDERAVMHRERTDKLFQEQDTNRDGMLSAAETEATCSRLIRRFDAIDADGNGQITRAEIQAHHEARAGHRRGKRGHRHHHDDAQ